jgi:hypothetical protein
MCRQCFKWCTTYLKDRFGYYSETILHEAVIAFHKPIPCKFYDLCGNLIPRISDKGHIQTNRQAICMKCRVAYEAGFKAGVYRIKNNPREALRNVRQ